MSAGTDLYLVDTNILVVAITKESPIYTEDVADFRKPSENFIYYSHYSSHRMTSTIQLSLETKQLIGTFGTKEDTYEEIIKRMYELATKEQLRQFLLSSEDAVPIDEALRRARKQWQK